MAIAQDASTPGANTGTVASGTLTVTTPAAGSFSPPVQSLLVAIVSIGHGPAGNPVVTVSDTGLHTWNTGPAVNGTDTTAQIYWAYLPGGATGIRVSAANSFSEGQGIQLDVRVLTGAAQSQAGAASNTNTGTSTSWTGSLTTTTAGSWVFIAAAANEESASISANANTTTLNNYQASGGPSSQLSGEQSSGTGTVSPGATVFGWTTTGGSVAFAWAALEILPATYTPLIEYPPSAIRARLPLPRRGTCRAMRFYPVPVLLTSGPAFNSARQPARIRPRLPLRGHISPSSPGAPVSNPPPPPPPPPPGVPPGISPGPTWLGFFKPQWPKPRPPVPLPIPVPPVFATGSIALTSPLAFSGAAANQGFKYLFTGHYAVYYLDYIDFNTQETLFCIPDNYYNMIVVSPRAGLAVPPRDGRWYGYPGLGDEAVLRVIVVPYEDLLAKGRALNADLQARLARGGKITPEEEED